MQINAIVAVCAENNGIGKNGGLPWHLRSDLRHFARLTKRGGGSAIIMGRNTWNSLPRKPLPGRINVIVSSRMNRSSSNSSDDIIVEQSLTTAIDRLRESKVDCCWIIGGAALYEEAFSLPQLDRIYLTRIYKTYDCDVFLPPIPYSCFIESTTDQDVAYDKCEENGIEFSHHVYTRRHV